MKPFSALFRWFFEPQDPVMLPAHERYLAESVDLNDLERRMRELEQRRPHHHLLGPFAWSG